jgi:hypothetical protein
MHGRRWHRAARAGNRAAAAAALADLDARLPEVAAAAAAYSGPPPPGVMGAFVAAALAYDRATTAAGRRPFLDLVRELCRTPTAAELTEGRVRRADFDDAAGRDHA